MMQETKKQPVVEPERVCLPQRKFSFSIFNDDGSLDREMLDIAARASHKESNEAEMEKALELSAAGWTPEIEKHHTPHPFTGNVMSWYWRRPARRKGSKGKKYLSTNQAWNALKKL